MGGVPEWDLSDCELMAKCEGNNLGTSRKTGKSAKNSGENTTVAMG